VPVHLIIAISHIFVALLIIAISVPLRRGEIGMNRFYGVRFPKSFESDEAWYKINRYGAQRLIFWSMILIGIGIAGVFLPLPDNEAIVIAYALAPLVYLIAAFESYRYSKTI